MLSATSPHSRYHDCVDIVAPSARNVVSVSVADHPRFCASAMYPTGLPHEVPGENSSAITPTPRSAQSRRCGCDQLGVAVERERVLPRGFLAHVMDVALVRRERERLRALDV